MSSADEPKEEPTPTAEREAAPAHPAAPAGPAWLPLAIAVALPVLFFFVFPLTKAGLWDPHELGVADLARRMAVNLHGATNLVLEGADNSLPHLNDLGRPQLPFTSIALGFKLFGLHEWAGRAPLALWGLLGVLATYAFVARLVDRRAAVFSAVALTTMPVFFVQARTMLGDIVTMSAFAMAFGGLAACVFGRREEEEGIGTPVKGAIAAPLLVVTGPVGALGLAATGGTRDQKKRLLFFVMACAGLGAGFMSRGSILGYAAPALGVGIAYLIALLHGHRRFDVIAHTAGALALVAGLAHAYIGIRALHAPQNDETVRIVGALLRTPGKYPTFDVTIGHVALALAPWSAFAPFAFGRLFVAPKVDAPSAFTRESHARVALLVGAAIALVAHGWMVARTDLVAFSAVALVAATCGIALRDYERGAHPSVAVGVGAIVLLALLRHELKHWPEKAFHAFAVTVPKFPESFAPTALLVWVGVLAVFGLVVFLMWVERDADRTPFDPKGYVKVIVALRDAWDGLLALVYFALVAGASLAGLAVWIGTRQHAKWLPQLSNQMREVVMQAWWVTFFVPLGVIFAAYFWSDVWLWAFNRAPAYGRGALTRGFEPFEELAARLKNAKLGSSLPKLLSGKLVVTKDDVSEGEGPVALFILAPLMYLMVPGIVYFVLTRPSKLISGVAGAEQVAGLKPLVAGALAVPSGVALFLLLGVLGVLFRQGRAATVAVFATVVGGVLCGFYYPALANQLSPKEVFESYQRVAKSGEPLALFGVGGKTAAYYAGGQPLTLRDTISAYDWLMGDPGGRRFLVVRAEELSRLNRVYRERSGTGENLPVIDSRSSQIILVASSLKPGEQNQNPLSRIVLTTPPKPNRPLDVNLDDKLQILGIDLVDANGRPVDHVSPGKKYHMRTYFKVLAPIPGEWQMFIHIDGFHRRHNGDHVMCQGKYPMSLWLPNDVIMDDHEFTLEPNFSPGPYTIWFGLFAGDTRMKVKSGPMDRDNRVNGGVLRVQ